MADDGGVQFSKTAAARIVSGIRAIEAMGVNADGTVGPRHTPSTAMRWCKIVSIANPITARPCLPDGTYTSTVSGNVINLTPLVPPAVQVGDVVKYLPANTNNTQQKGILLPIGPILFPVSLTQTGGSNGNQSTAASYTYTVKDVTATTTLGTTKGVTWSRPNGSVTAATHGTAYYDASNTLVLWQADETPGSGHC